jgi:hypothetical protein
MADISIGTPHQQHTGHVATPRGGGRWSGEVVLDDMFGLTCVTRGHTDWLARISAFFARRLGRSNSASRGCPDGRVPAKGADSATCAYLVRRSFPCAQVHEREIGRLLQAARPMKARFGFADRTGTFDGIWTAADHCEMEVNTSTHGMAP